MPVESTNKGFVDPTSKSSRATDRGTRVVKKGKELDKNAFLRILTAELANQDPMNAKDSTQYVSQMAQFASMEQMTNLNTTMTFSSANSMVGKLVALNSYDDVGQQYGGYVKSVVKNGSDVLVNVEVNDKGKLVNKEFSISDISDIIHTSNSQLDSLNFNMNFLTSSAFIGKEVTAANEDGAYAGKVKSVIKGNNDVIMKVEVTGKVTNTKMTPVSPYTKDEVIANGVYSGDENAYLKVKFTRYPEDGESQYQYKLIPEGENEENINWTNLQDGESISGIKVTVPKEVPIADAEWTTQLEHIDSTVMNFSSRNVLEVSEQDK